MPFLSLVSKNRLEPSITSDVFGPLDSDSLPLSSSIPAQDIRISEVKIVYNLKSLDPVLQKTSIAKFIWIFDGLTNIDYIFGSF